MEIDQVYLMQLVIGWTCVGVFVCTALITLLSVIGLIQIDHDLRNKLYAGLIVEIVAIAVAVFSGLVKIDPKPVTQQLEAGVQAEQTLTAIETSKTVEPPAQTGTPSAAELQPRVYIQIADDSQRDLAIKARDSLRKAGQLVPGVERVGSKAPNSTELRYFLPAEEALAETISNELRAVGITAPARFVSGFENANIRQHHFELWFSRT